MTKQQAILFIVALISLVAPSLLSAERRQKGAEQTVPEWSKYTLPNEKHRVLEQLLGRWRHTSRSWDGPSGKPLESQGVTVNKWMLGKRALYSDTRRKMGREPFEGIAVFAFDSIRKQYTWTSFDTLSTGVFQAYGDYDASSNLFSFQGTFSDPVSAIAGRPFRAELKVFDVESYAITVYLKDPREVEFKSIEILYSRK